MQADTSPPVEPGTSPMEEGKPGVDSNQTVGCDTGGEVEPVASPPAAPRRSIARLWALLAALWCGLLAADLGTKHWAEASLQHRPRRRVTVIEGWLDLTYVRNPAGAWGFMRGMDPNKRHYVLLAVSMVAVGVLLFLLLRSRPEQIWLRVALTCILAGALGNIVDRVRWRYVVDFVDWHKWFRWPTFNVADIAITAGVIMMAVEILLNRHQPRTSSEGSSEPVPGESPATGRSRQGGEES